MNYDPYLSAAAGYEFGRMLIPVVIFIIVFADVRYGCIGG